MRLTRRMTRRAWLRRATALAIIALAPGSIVQAGRRWAGHWEARAPMPTARTEVAAAVLDGLIYVVGGQVDGGNGITDAVEVYDAGTDTWHVAAPLPEP